MAGLNNPPESVNKLSKCPRTGIYAVQLARSIQLHDPRRVKVQTTNDQLEKLALVKHTCKVDAPILASEFHSEDGGLLFASDKEGDLHFFDLNNLASSESALKFKITPRAQITHIS